MLDSLMFDKFLSSLFVVVVVFVSAKASICSHIFDGVVMHEIVKGGVFEFIGLGRTKKRTVSCEFRQDWFGFVVMYKTRVPHVNVMKNVLWEGTKLCAIFRGKIVFSRASGSFKVGRVLYREYRRMSWGPDRFIIDAVEPHSYVFLILTPREHGW